MVESSSNITKDVKRLDTKGVDFKGVAKEVAEKTASLRRSEGRLPMELFLSSLEMQGVYPCLELVIKDKEGNLYLKRRASEENATQAEEEAWGGRLHIPGRSVFPATRFEMNLYSLLNKEVIGGEEGREKSKLLADVYRNTKTLGIVMYPEPERKTDALTFLMEVVVKDPKILQEGFEKITQDNLSDVIDQHKRTVKKVLQPRKGPLMFDAR